MKKKMRIWDKIWLIVEKFLLVEILDRLCSRILVDLSKQRKSLVVKERRFFFRSGGSSDTIGW